MTNSWMYSGKLDNKFLEGVDKFCNVLVNNLTPANKGYIFCPCVDCKNYLKYREIEKIKEHLIRRGFTKDYEAIVRWHGESAVNVMCNEQDYREDNQTTVVDEHNTEDNEPDFDDIAAMLEDVEQEFYNRPDTYETLLDSSKTPLYPGCDPTKLSKLSAVLKLFNLKSKHGWSDVSFTALLQLMKSVLLPADNVLPTSTYEAKKLMCPMGMGYKKIHACPSGCILYRKDYEFADSCPECGESRYTKKKQNESGGRKEKSPAKVLWYLPIIPRFKRLFANEKDAENLMWHSTHRNKDGKLRHPADASQWKNIDKTFPHFGSEPRNLRLGLCTDGMNPFGTLSSIHSTWPVLLVIYNLPPWLCMKPRHILLSLLISGPKQPGNKIDVFLQPLIEDLQLMWKEGVMVYDSFSKENFLLHAMLYCTVNDFPAYGNLSGYTNKGACACPICGERTSNIRLKHSGKNVYMGHRQMLPKSHKYRKMSIEFDGKTDHSVARPPLSGLEVYGKVQHIVNNFGPPTRNTEKSVWKKKSIFWELEYWQHLDVRHCIDAMHVEKNVGESVTSTLLNIKGKTKDHLNGRKDLIELGIRQDLWPQERGKRTFLPPACHTLSKQEKHSLCSILHNIKVPSGYSSNIRNLVSMSDLKLVGMKSHDYHVLMQDFLPVAIRGILPDAVRNAITNLCVFLKAVSAKVHDVDNLEKLQADLIVTMCQLEMYFPPSFFDIMVHLLVHLVREVKECGPVYLRYMYPFERYMGILKKKMKNRCRPEGSIIEGYVTEEVVDFCTHYLENVESIGLPKSRHEGRLQGQGTVGRKLKRIDIETLNKAHLVVLSHLEIVEPYFDEHLNMLRAQNPTMSDIRLKKEQNKTFVRWFKDKVFSEHSNGVEEIVRTLALGPNLDVVSYEGYDVNGFTFYTERQDQRSTNQNSGINVVAYQSTYNVRGVGQNPVEMKQSYYGVIQDIWVLDYTNYETCVFRCNWIDNKHGYREEKHGMKRVHLGGATPTVEPFVVATKAKQVFYIPDQSNPRWSIVLQGKRGIVGVDGVVDEDEYDMQDEIPNLSIQLPTEADHITNFVRSDHGEGMWVD